MVSKAVCTSAQGAIQYFENHLNIADYFVESEKVDRGQFIGKVAERLGLDEVVVTREKFAAFVECDMKGLGADSKRQRVSEIKYIEFTYSPPKAVSVVAALDDRVKVELYEAVKEELRWFETQVTVRDRRGNLANEEVTKPTGQMIAALFQHETSRTNDPDFHVHTLIGNVTWDAERKGYFAVHYGRMLELRKTLDARVHNNLAARMGALGYQVEAAPSGFGLKEVPASVVDKFSERGRQVQTVKALLKRGYTPQQITKALKGLSEDEKRKLLAKPDALQATLGRAEGKPRLVANHLMDQQSVTLTRPKKVRITSKTLREDVAKRLHEAGLVVKTSSPFPVKARLDLTEAIRQGTQIAFEKQSVVRLDYLLGEIVRLAPGAIANEKLAEQLRDDRRFLIRRMDKDEVVTTRQILGEEKTLLTSIIRGMNQHAPLQKDYVAPAALVATPERIDELVTQARVRGEQLTPAQAEKWLNQFAAIHRYVCTSHDQFVNIRGGAGVGKTFCVEQLVGQSLQAGRLVFICAPYGEQARVTLRNESPRLEASGQKEVARIFAQANTVDSLLVQARNDPLRFRGAVRAVFDRSRIERGPGEKLLLQEKIKQENRIFEKGSRQTIARVIGDTVQFESGLQLRTTDGRVRQGDCLTDYKAQGIKGAQVRGIEDNGSAMAMANKEAFHVKGTRHVQNLILHVENKGLYVEAIQRSNVKFSALELERLPVSLAPAVASPLSVDKGRLLMQIRAWGREFLPRVTGHKRAEQIRQHLARFEALYPRPVEVVVEKVTPIKEAITEKMEKLTPAPQETTRQTPGERLTPSVEEMAQKLRQKRREKIAQTERPAPRSQPSVSERFRPAPPSQRQGPRMGM